MLLRFLRPYAPARATPSLQRCIPRGRTLRMYAMTLQDVVLLPNSTPPCCSRYPPQTRVDITVHNLLSLHTTRLLASYCELDPRLRQLVLLVKHWARARGVNDVYRYTTKGRRADANLPACGSLVLPNRNPSMSCSTAS